MCHLLIHLIVQVKIVDKKQKESIAEIRIANKSDLKNTSKDWKFNWLQLHTSKSKFYQLIHENKIQGLIKLEEENELYYVLKNIEVAPINYGSKGQFKNIADLLISFACLKSFELNKGNYKGFLVFTSKGSLIEYYETKYGAKSIFRERMIISPGQGKKLILKNLKINLDDE